MYLLFPYERCTLCGATGGTFVNKQEDREFDSPWKPQHEKFHIIFPLVLKTTLIEDFQCHLHDNYNFHFWKIAMKPFN